MLPDNSALDRRSFEDAGSFRSLAICGYDGRRRHRKLKTQCLTAKTAMIDPAGNIRDVRLSDAGQIVEIYAPYIVNTAISFEALIPTPDEIRTRIAETTASWPWIVFEDDDQLCGYAYASAFRTRHAYRYTAESTVYVRASCTGIGIGRRLMDELLSRLRTVGCHIVIAGITLPNPASVALHERLGFRPVGVFPHVGRKFDQWHDVGFWSLELSPGPTAS